MGWAWGLVSNPPPSPVCCVAWVPRGHQLNTQRHQGLGSIFLLLGLSHHLQVTFVHIWPEFILHSEYLSGKKYFTVAVKVRQEEGVPQSEDTLGERWFLKVSF